MSTSNPTVLFIVGPTAVGKTRLAVALAQRFNGEIINADSRQVYRYMDIGTAKPTPQERAQVPHHLLDILDPGEDFGLASFLALARTAIDDVLDRGRLPIVVGGTGQYVWALIEDWRVPQVPPDPSFRKTKMEEADRHGHLFLYQQLQAVDPQRAAKLDPQNVRRVIRALEVRRGSQRRPSEFQTAINERSRPMENTLVIGLNLDREELYRRIDERVDRMLAAGLLQEVQELARQGYQLGHGPLSSPGYRELGQYLDDEITLAEAVQRTKFQTHRLVRRQYTWFKLSDKRINWHNAADSRLEDRAAQLVKEPILGQDSCDTMGEQPPRRPADEIHQDARCRQ